MVIIILVLVCFSMVLTLLYSLSPQFFARASNLSLNSRSSGTCSGLLMVPLCPAFCSGCSVFANERTSISSGTTLHTSGRKLNFRRCTLNILVFAQLLGHTFWNSAYPLPTTCEASAFGQTKHVSEGIDWLKEKMPQHHMDINGSYHTSPCI